MEGDREMSDNTLTSFHQKSRNQKKCLIEAMKCVFAQAYRPLEIVISGCEWKGDM